MDEKEFKKQLNKEVEDIDISERPYNMAEKAFYDRQSKLSNSTKIKKNRLFRILSSSVAFSVIIGFTIWLVFSSLTSNNINFNSQTPSKDITFEEISLYTDKQIPLPLEFDEGFEIASIKMFFPKEDEPCAIEIVYNNDIKTISVMIMIDTKYEYYFKDVYLECNLHLDRSDVVGNYFSSNEYRNYIRAHFSKLENEYFFYGIEIEFNILESFINSLS